MHSRLDLLLQDRRGATAVEYGLIAALICVAGVGALWLLGVALRAIFLAMEASLMS